MADNSIQEPRKRGRPKKSMNDEAEVPVPKKVKKSASEQSSRLNRKGANTGDSDTQHRTSEQINNQSSRAAKGGRGSRSDLKDKPISGKPSNTDEKIAKQGSVTISKITEKPSKLKKEIEGRRR